MLLALRARTTLNYHKDEFSKLHVLDTIHQLCGDVFWSICCRGVLLLEFWSGVNRLGCTESEYGFSREAAGCKQHVGRQIACTWHAIRLFTHCLFWYE